MGEIMKKNIVDSVVTGRILILFFILMLSHMNLFQNNAFGVLAVSAAEKRDESVSAAKEKSDLKRKQVVLIGSSSIEYWKKAPAAFSPMQTVNLGIAGSTAEEWLNTCYKKVAKYQPDAIVVYVGGNDIINGCSGIRTARWICCLLERLRTVSVGAPVYYVSIAPSPKYWRLWNEIKKCNWTVREYCKKHKKIQYINLSNYCLRRNGTLKKELYRTKDRLHFNNRGYRIWNRVVAGRVKRNVKQFQ